jgi:hypothetical protein
VAGSGHGDAHPVLRSVVLDAIDARVLAEFHRELLGLRYSPGDEPPPSGEPDPACGDWLVLVDPAGHPFCIFVAAPGG